MSGSLVSLAKSIQEEVARRVIAYLKDRDDEMALLEQKMICKTCDDTLLKHGTIIEQCAKCDQVFHGPYCGYRLFMDYGTLICKLCHENEFPPLKR